MSKLHVATSWCVTPITDQTGSVALYVVGFCLRFQLRFCFPVIYYIVFAVILICMIFLGSLNNLWNQQTNKIY